MPTITCDPKGESNVSSKKKLLEKLNNHMQKNEVHALCYTGDKNELKTV